MTLKFEVLRPFVARHAISGRDYRFEPGQTILCDTGQNGEIMTIEVDTALFLVERPIFKECCKFKNEGSPIF